MSGKKFLMKCVIVLESVFSDNKLSFRCFDCSPRLSVGSGCELESARAHKNFDIVFDFGWQPAQIHIRVQLRLTGTSLCQCCRVTDEILRALVQIPIMHPYSDRQTGRDIKHWKDYFNIERKNTFLERSHFSSLLLPGHRRKFGLFL